jgi:hypothetical protein
MNASRMREKRSETGDARVKEGREDEGRKRRTDVGDAK